MRIDMFRHYMLACVAAALMVTTACGGKTPPADVAAAPADAAAVEVAAPPSRVDEAKAFMSRALEPAALKEAIALADALAGEPSAEAKLMAARIRLVSAARGLAAARDGGEPALGPDEIAQAITKVIDATEKGQIAGEEGVRIAVAAEALKKLAGVGDGAPDAAKVRALIAETNPEAAAVRLALTGRFLKAREEAEAQGFAAFVKTFGPWVCAGCTEPTDAVAKAPAKDGAGLTCASAEDASYCKTLMAASAEDPIAASPENALVIAAMATIAAGGAEDATLAAALGELGRAREPVVLPVPVALEGEAILGAGDAVRLVEAAPALIVAHVAPGGVRIGVRRVTGPDGLVKLGAGLALADAPVVTLEALAAAEPDAESGAIAGVSDRLASVVAGIAELELPGERGPVLMVIAPGVASEIVAKVADGIRASGPVALRVMRPGTPGEALPIFMRTLPEELETALVPAWQEPTRVVVQEGALDVWAPEGENEGAVTLGPDAAAGLPAGLEQGWRKDKLARLRVRVSESGIGEAELAALVQGVKAFAEGMKAGRVVHVIAGEGARVEDVLKVARHLQEGGLEAAPELTRVGEIWPGARCRGEGGCAGAVAVALSQAAIPSARGLSDKPGDKKEPKEVKPAEPKPEPGPAPSAEFCNQADIRAQMNKQAGNFRFCYERELQLEKDLAGRLVMNFVIGLSGNVKSVRVASSDLKNAKVGECIKKAIGKMQFKAPDGGECVVQWPFKFSAN